jgi:carbohydrate diacid regulator
MSSRIFQSVIIQMKDATDRVFGVAVNQGFVVACSELSMIGSYLDDMQGLNAEAPDQLFTSQLRTYKLIGSPDSQFDYTVFVEGHDAPARCICLLAAVAMNEAKTNSRRSTTRPLHQEHHLRPYPAGRVYVGRRSCIFPRTSSVWSS